MAIETEHEEGLAEWIMSYADMITILMAFFVVMYSMAGNKDNGKSEAVMASLREWLGPTDTPWPRHPGTRNRSLVTPFDTPADPNRARGAAPGPVADAPRPTNGFPDGVSLYFALGTDKLSAADEQDLASALALVAGKSNLIEIRGQVKRHAEQADTSESADAVYGKCRLVLDYLLGRGIDPERVQIRMVRADRQLNGQDLAVLKRDIQVDVLLLPQRLEPQPAAPAAVQK